MIWPALLLAISLFLSLATSTAHATTPPSAPARNAQCFPRLRAALGPPSASPNLGETSARSGEAASTPMGAPQDPELGRYLSEDPIGVAGGVARYGYVHDPMGWVDWWGLTGGCGSAPEELAAVGPLAGRSRKEIEADLLARGFSGVPAKSGGTVFTKAMPDGSTAAVRLDPAKARPKPKGFADEVPHAHKEAVPTTKVSKGNYDPADATPLNDAAAPARSKAESHIPVLW